MYCEKVEYRSIHGKKRGGWGWGKSILPKPILPGIYLA